MIETEGNLQSMYLVQQNNHVLVIAQAQNMASAIQKLEFVIARKDILEKNVMVS